MHAEARLLVIGSSALGAAAGHTLPGWKIVSRDTPLAGLWQMGKESFDGVLISLSAGKNVLRTLNGMRELDTDARIVVACEPALEPAARRALDEGADDYVLEPLCREELERCFEPPGDHRASRADDSAPSLQELVGLGEILQSLGSGPQATLERFAALLRKTFDAAGVAIELDGRSATVGEPGEPTREETLYRKGTPVGRVSLTLSSAAARPAGPPRNLRDYAPLIEAAVAQAGEHDHWRDLAWTDDLSGLRNRRYFERTLSELVGRATGRRMQLTLFLFDIDDFKSYNDAYGHETGDGLIREVAELLLHCSRERDVVTRYGGDEFAVILWDAEKPRVAGSKHPTEPAALAERFRRAIGEHAFKCLGPDAPGKVTISGGLASFPWDGTTAEELINAADRALLQAKRVGKNQILLSGGAFDENTPGE